MVGHAEGWPFRMGGCGQGLNLSAGLRKLLSTMLHSWSFQRYWGGEEILTGVEELPVSVEIRRNWVCSHSLIL